MSRRSRAIDIYLKAGIEEDDLVFAIWTALHGTGRPQDVFRRALRIGLRMLAETGELPRAALQQAESGLLGPPAPAMAFLLRGMAAAARAPAAAPQRAPPAATKECFAGRGCGLSLQSGSAGNRRRRARTRSGGTGSGRRP